MKKGFLPFSFLLVTMLLASVFVSSTDPAEGQKYTPRNNEFPSADDYLNSLKANQHTGLIAPEDVMKAKAAANAMGSVRGSDEALNWFSLGPDNFGGKTKAILFDNKDASAQTVLVGSAGGGIFRTQNQGITWHHLGSTNIQVSSMVQLPNGDIFVGTGDGFEAQKYSVFGDLAYTTGLMGEGIFTSTDGENFTVIPGTQPAANDNLSPWAFINELAVDMQSSRIYAATNGGLRYSDDSGASWSFAKDDAGADLTDNASCVKVGSDGTVVASVANKCYVSADGAENAFVNYSTGSDTTLPNASVTRLELAIAPSAPNVMYAALVDNIGIHIGIYKSENKGLTWEVILPATNTVNIFQQRGNYNNGITVFPDDPYRIIVGGVNLWQGRKIVEGGYYSWDTKSRGDVNSIFPGYVHIGQQDLVFVPNQNNAFFVSTDGGVHSGVVNGDEYTFTASNRNMISTQFYSVAPSGGENKVLGGAQDQGSIYISALGNTTKQGSELWFQGGFSNNGHGGPCVISTINPEAIVLSATAGQMRRSEDLAFTFSTQFLGGNMLNTQAFQTPIALWESYEDQNSRDTVYFHARKSYAGGSVIKVRSHNFDHPFYYTLPANHSLEAGDSIAVKDIVATKLFIAVANRLWMTKEFLTFSKTPEWFEIANTSVGFSGIPQSMAYSADANHVFVGMRNGKLFRVSNIALAYNYARADVNSPDCIISTKEIVINLPGTSTPISQAITSVSVDPKNPNNVVITLANYGNNDYVYMSNNALSANPTFTSKQGNLPKMPVYASVIEMSDPSKVIIGTEQGIFITDNISSPNWYTEASDLSNVPVFDLKQQYINKSADTIQLINVDTLVVTYPGTNNLGILYAATYGRGLYRCNNFRKPVGIDETPLASADNFKVTIYPNPVRESANVAFELKASNQVSYQIYDLTGKMIRSASIGQLGSGMQQLSIPTEGLSNGAYILSIRCGNQVGTTKFLRY
ncbi:MAG: T9SS type A sorting domain-containing protein [Bacteroidales bacterium]|nr:T9SS type A sorting domain-containing protein [Bacteroidales bacterium]